MFNVGNWLLTKLLEGLKGRALSWTPQNIPTKLAHQGGCHLFQNQIGGIRQLAGTTVFRNTALSVGPTNQEALPLPFKLSPVSRCAGISTLEHRYRKLGGAPEWHSG